MSKKWAIFIADEGGMSQDTAKSPRDLGQRIDTPNEAERLAAEAWASSSRPGDQFCFCNGVAVDVTGGSVA